jgi:hypothetical protein
MGYLLASFEGGDRGSGEEKVMEGRGEAREESMLLLLFTSNVVPLAACCYS